MMNELVYYFTPAEHVYAWRDGSCNSVNDEKFDVEIVVRNSKNMYKTFFSEEFTDKTTDLARFIILFSNFIYDMSITYDDAHQCESILINNESELENILELFNLRRITYRIEYRTDDVQYMVAYSDNSGVLYLYTYNKFLGMIENTLNQVATKTTFEEYELDS